MEYVAIGIIVLVALATGVWAYSMVGTLKKPNKEEIGPTPDEEAKLPNDVDKHQEGGTTKKNAVATFPNLFKELSPRRWVLLGVCACLTGLAAVRLLIFTPGGVSGMKFAVAAVMLLPAMIVDLNTGIIPNSLVLAMLVVGTAFHGMQLIVSPDTRGGVILEAVIGLLGCLILFYVMARLTKDGMGMGDVKQLAALGWMVGIRIALISALFGLIVCTLLAIALMVSKKKKARDSIPFGPFIFAGYLLAVLICNF